MSKMSVSFRRCTDLHCLVSCIDAISPFFISLLLALAIPSGILAFYFLLSDALRMAIDLEILDLKSGLEKTNGSQCKQKNAIICHLEGSFVLVNGWEACLI